MQHEQQNIQQCSAELPIICRKGPKTGFPVTRLTEDTLLSLPVLDRQEQICEGNVGRIFRLKDSRTGDLSPRVIAQVVHSDDAFCEQVGGAFLSLPRYFANRYEVELTGCQLLPTVGIQQNCGGLDRLALRNYFESSNLPKLHEVAYFDSAGNVLCALRNGEVQLGQFAIICGTEIVRDSFEILNTLARRYDLKIDTLRHSCDLLQDLHKRGDLDVGKMILTGWESVLDRLGGRLVSAYTVRREPHDSANRATMLLVSAPLRKGLKLLPDSCTHLPVVSRKGRKTGHPVTRLTDCEFQSLPILETRDQIQKENLGRVFRCREQNGGLSSRVIAQVVKETDSFSQPEAVRYNGCTLNRYEVEFLSD